MSSQKKNDSFWLEHGLLLFIVLVALPDTLPYHSQPYPRGLAKLVDLSWLHHETLYGCLKWSVLLWFLSLRRTTLFFYAHALILLVLTFNLQHAQGIANHSNHLLGLILVGKLMTPLFRGRFTESTFITPLMAAFYVTSALSKIMNSLGSWIKQAPDILGVIIKSNDSRYYDHLSESYWHRMDGMVEALAGYHWVLYLLFIFIFALEFCAWMACVNQSSKRRIGWLLVVMHFGITCVMTLNFSVTILCLLVYYCEIHLLLEPLVHRALGENRRFTSN